MAEMFLSRTASTATPASSGAISFSTPLTGQTVTEGGTATFNWLATAPSGGTITYSIHTDPDTDNWDFGTQTTTSKSFPGVLLSETGTVVQVIADNGVDTPAESRATITVTPIDGGGGGGGGGGGLSIERVYFHGHSLMGVGFVNKFTQADYLGQQLTANGFICHGIQSNSGFTAAQALSVVQGNRSAWIGADAIVFDYGINGDETATAYKAAVKALADYVHSQDPTIHVAVMEAHSSSLAAIGQPGSQSNVIARWTNKNPTLAALKSEGSIDSVIPWEDYAEANKQIESSGGLFYYSDGVHHWNNQGPYADKMIDHLIELTVGAPPIPGSLSSRHMGFDNYSDTHFGNPLAITGPGNVQIKSGVSLGFPFKAVETGSITQAAFNLKYNNSKTYSGGTGGVCRVDIYPADSTGRPNGATLGGYTLPDVVAPGDSIETGNGWVAPHSLASAASVTEGNSYCMVFTNTDGSPNTNFFSINMMVEYPDGSLTPPNPAYEAIATGSGYFRSVIKGTSYWNPTGGATWNDYYLDGGSTALDWHKPCFEIYYASGNRQGQAYVGARYFDPDYERILSGSIRYRMSMLSKRAGRTATHLNLFGGYHPSPFRTGVIVNAIVRNAAGTQLATATLTPNGAYWGKGALSTSLAIANNTEYLVDIYYGGGSTMGIRPCQTSLNGHGWSGAGFSDCPGAGLFVSTNGGASFSQPGGGAAYDLGLFFDTTV